MWTAELLVMAVMVAVNSVFAGYEIALASVSLARLDVLIRDGRRGAHAAHHMKQNMEASLAVVQLGITLVGVIAAATGGSGAGENLEPYLRSRGFSEGTAELLALALVVMPLTVITIIFGELVPKVFAIRNKEAVCLKLSPAMRFFAITVWPVVWLFESAVQGIMRLFPGDQLDAEDRHAESTLQELRALAALARTSRLIGSREESIIINAARLASTTARSAMLPADYISLLTLDDPVADSLIQAHNDMHTRFPVVERRGDPQSIVGYVNFKDIIACLRLSPQEPSLRGILRPLISFPDQTPLTTCLERLIHEHTHIALIRDAGQRIVGMITLEDVIEELVGDIKDEFDRLPSLITATGSGWLICGGTPIEAIRSETGIALPAQPGEPATATLNDWLSHHLGRSVKPGEELKVGADRILIRKTRRNAVLEAVITPGRSPQSQNGRQP